MKRISSFTGSQQAVLPIMGSVRLTLVDPAEGDPGFLHVGRKKQRHAEGRLIKRWGKLPPQAFSVSSEGVPAPETNGSASAVAGQTAAWYGMHRCFKATLKLHLGFVK
jgi:hypothetical protein